MPARGIGESVSGVKTAQANMNSAFNPLSNINKLSGMPFSSRNIGQAVAQAAINYNSAYSAFIIASLDCEVATLVSGLIYSGMQFGIKKGIIELLKLTGWF